MTARVSHGNALWQREDQREGGKDSIVLVAFSDTHGIIGRQKQHLALETGGSAAVDALEQACS